MMYFTREGQGVCNMDMYGDQSVFLLLTENEYMKAGQVT